jgi:hypothetical protein
LCLAIGRRYSSVFRGFRLGSRKVTACKLDPPVKQRGREFWFVFSGFDRELAISLSMPDRDGSKQRVFAGGQAWRKSLRELYKKRNAGRWLSRRLLLTRVSGIARGKTKSSPSRTRTYNKPVNRWAEIGVRLRVFPGYLLSSMHVRHE